MALLTKTELQTEYYKASANVDDTLVDTYLVRANTFCKGCIGGEPAQADLTTDEWVDVKTATALAFEIMTAGKSAVIDETTGNITDAAPSGEFVKGYSDPLAVVKAMLKHIALKMASKATTQSDRRAYFI